MVTRVGAYDPGVSMPGAPSALDRGFTLIELCYVVTVITLLAAITVPVYDVLLRRARADEAHAFLHDLAHAQLRALRDHGEYVACPPEGEVPDPVAAFDSDRACWKQLGVIVEGPVRFRYGVTVADGSFSVTAEGDLDGDGETSLYTLDGRTFAMDIRDELE